MAPFQNIKNCSFSTEMESLQEDINSFFCLSSEFYVSLSAIL